MLEPEMRRKDDALPRVMSLATEVASRGVGEGLGGERG